MELGDYNSKLIEEKYRKYWEKEKIYKFNPKTKKKIYSIDVPPPYASAGHLHVGHALSYTQFEIIARIMRQLGFEVYFAPGFDDNGLPTEKYVEEKYKINKAKTNRQEFRKLCLEESKKIEKIYIDNVFKKLGHSYDWDLLYTTISPEAQKVTQTSFLKLISSGNCYQKEAPTIWCPCHETALAQAEVEDLERETKLNYIDFDSDSGKVTIATTRPEFLPACVGIFVNPEDKRYKDLIGKNLAVPLFNFKVKVRADKLVDKDFGTGVVMVCTFGDNTDIEWWKKYKLELKNLLNPNGTLNALAGSYQGFSIKDAREKILEDLKSAGRLKKQESLHQTLGACWRCSTPVEYIVTKQWFIKTLSHKKELISQGKKIIWHPDFMRTRYENWTKNLNWDWIISRQRYYGVPIPVWYCDDCGEIILPKENELPLDPLEIKKKCPKCLQEARAETDVFDTWMTSSNSPEVAGKWLENPEIYKKISPMSLRPQSHDIIRTWAFYTILKSHLLFNRIPWKEIAINTYVLDSKGKAMHKSKGNSVWADELMEKYSVDALRYWVASASLGSDLPFKEEELIAGKKFLTKLWNVSKFVFMNQDSSKPGKVEPIDEYLLQTLASLIDKVKLLYLSYDIAGARRLIDDFFWHVFADDYLEIIKSRVYNATGDKKSSAQYVLHQTLLAIIKMMAPITPFITEEIYQSYYAEKEKSKSIHISEWPDLKVKQNLKLQESGNLFREILKKVRQEKSNTKSSMKSEIILTLEKSDLKKLKQMLEDLKAVTNSKEIKPGKFKVEFI